MTADYSDVSARIKIAVTRAAVVEGPSHSRDVMLYAAGTTFRLSPRECQRLEGQLREARRASPVLRKPASLRRINSALSDQWYKSLAEHGVGIGYLPEIEAKTYQGPSTGENICLVRLDDNAAKPLCEDLDRFVKGALAGKPVHIDKAPRAHVVHGAYGASVYWRVTLRMQEAMP